jgi:DNA mismatch repair protein MutL
MIKRLPDDLINKIAAGEVVERPASVLKELLDNALDAGSKNIQIELEEGGSKRITIIDDGSGIQTDQMELAFCRHATSKIDTTEDLFNIRSMGFRGEALSSIAGVAKVCLDSKPIEQDQGCRLVIHGGSKISQDSIPMPNGTQVTVEDLFFNIPARKAFLKKNEYPACLEVVQKLALSHLSVGFRLFHNQKLQIDFAPNTTLRHRLSALFSQDSVESLIEVEHKNTYGTVHGLISPPGYEKSSSRYIHIFVNHRPVEDKALRFAILRGYHSHLLKGQYPVAVLFLECDPSIIDVNVHPAKTEVRFQYAPEVQSLIASGIRESLRRGDWAKSPSQSSSILDYFASQPETSTRSYEAKTLNFNEPQGSSYTPSSFAPKEVLSLGQRESRPLQQVNVTPTIQQDIIPWQDLKFVGELSKCYLLFEYQGDLLCVDQHAFHERILYEQLRSNPKTFTKSQPLLVAEAVELRATQIARLMEAQATMENYGFRWHMVNETTLEVQAVPQLLAQRSIEDMLAEISESECDSMEQLSEKVLATMACHGAVRAGDSLNEGERGELISLASKVDFYMNCPHGRRVFKWWSNYQVQRWFDR